MTVRCPATIASREPPLGGVPAGIHTVLVCFALKMTSGGIATLAALILSIAVIHLVGH
jgi:hypothetical protein